MLAPRKKLWSTPSSAIDIALDFADLHADDVVYDVGCGDGRVLIQMASMSVPIVQSEVSTVHDDDDVDAASSSDNVVAENNGYEHTTNKKKDHQQTQHASSSSTNSTKAITTSPQPKPKHHHCHKFIGIEISPQRAAEARLNIKKAQQSHQIPSHVSIEIICANALDTEAVDYSKATVIFLYLVPRGLRLIKDLVWPPPQNSDSDLGLKEEEESLLGSALLESLELGSRKEDEEPRGESKEKEETTTAAASDETISNGLQSKPQLSLLQSQDESTTITKNATISNNTNDTISVTKKAKRRIITYMAPFENTTHVRKKYCTVEHQEGAAWPVYLYHV